MITRILTSVFITVALTAQAQEPAVNDSVASSPKLSERCDSLRQCLETALPYAVDAISGMSAIMDREFSALDRPQVERLIADSRMLMPSASALAEIVGKGEAVISAATTLDSVSSYFSRPYDKGLNDSLSATIATISADRRLSESQHAEIAGTGKKLDNYYYALLRFDNLIGAVNDAVAELREIPGSEKLAAGEVKTVLDENKSSIAFISRYEWLYGIFGDYESRITADPLDRPDEIETLVSALVGATEEPPADQKPDTQPQNDNPTTP